MLLHNILALPPTIILTILCATATAEEQWPYNVPRHMKYFPEDEGLAKRALDIKRKMGLEKPIGVRKMSTDEGAMFMLDDWIFASDLVKRDDNDDLGNGTCEALSPLRPIENDDFFSRFKIRAALSKRQFACPAGTNSCAGVGAPDVCCGSGSNCVTVNNSPGVGSVGCCPQGQSCAGSISCDTKNGYSSCPDSKNGGCCLPGYSCAGIGCAAGGTSTVFPTPSPTPTPSPSSTAVIVVPTSPSTSPIPTPTPSSSSQANTCTGGFFLCPASQGGGCCRNGQTCGSSNSCLGGSPSTTQAPSAPIRPTSGTASSSSIEVCPAGFYVCSAVYPNGCCRVGRDCQTTGSCELPVSTILNTNGVVVVAPTGAGVANSGAPQRGSCPSAWYSCAANRGGNCCPDGFECGEQCTATASGQSGVSQKVAPSTASIISNFSIWTMMTASAAIGIAMVIL